MAQGTFLERLLYHCTTWNNYKTNILKDNLLTLNEEGGELSYYKVEENHLRKLTMDKQEITGELADHYVLNKE